MFRPGISLPAETSGFHRNVQYASGTIGIFSSTKQRVYLYRCTGRYEIDFPALAPYDLLVQDARIFSRFFTQLLYSHTKKKCNKVAHSLTRNIITSLECVVWTEDVPSQLSFVI